MTAPGVKVRRFERGASAEGWDRFLVDLGYTISGFQTGNTWKISKGAGRPKTVNRQGLIAILDMERMARGLEPIRLPAPCSAQCCAEGSHGESLPRTKVDKPVKRDPARAGHFSSNEDAT